MCRGADRTGTKPLEQPTRKPSKRRSTAPRTSIRLPYQRSSNQLSWSALGAPELRARTRGKQQGRAPRSTRALPPSAGAAKPRPPAPAQSTLRGARPQTRTSTWPDEIYHTNGERLVLVPRLGCRSQVELSYDFTHCTNCDRQIASGIRELSSSASLSPDLRYFLVQGASAAERACIASTCLLDLVTHTITQLAAEAAFGGFDPTSRYFILGNTLFLAQPLRRIGELP
jgi:hypothetical protein